MINKKKVKFIIAIFIIASISFAFDSQELAMIDKIKKICAIEIDNKRCSDNNACGLYDINTKTIILKDGMVEQYKHHTKQTIIHEFAHFLCRNLIPETIVEVKSKSKKYSDKSIYIYAEVVADSISIICTKQLFGGDYIKPAYVEILGSETFLKIAIRYADIIDIMSIGIITYLGEEK